MLPDRNGRRPLALYLIAAVYLFSLLFALVSYGSPYAFFGRFYAGTAGSCFVFADAMISLYLLIGTLKRQRLSFFIALAYNILDLANAWLNLSLIPASQYAAVAGVSVSAAQLTSDTLAASAFVIAVTACLIANRRHFDNDSLYLF